MSSKKKSDKKPAKITPLAQHYIDVFRNGRLERGISPEELSKEISPFEGDSLVRKIENQFTSNKYTPATIKRAMVFLKIPSDIVFPATLLSSDTLQEKTKLIILKGMTAIAAVRSLLEEGYFEEGRTRHETWEFANGFYEEKKSEKFFDPALEALYNEGKLIKLEPGATNKLIRFQRNPEYDPNE